MSLDGKVAIVTGAGSGIGVSIAAELHRRGALVAVFDINEAGARETVDGFNGGPPGLALRVDVSDEHAVRVAVEEVVSRFGRIDVLVNNAGIFDGRPKAAETTTELWNKILAVNLTGQFLMARAVLPTMIDQGDGVIVNIASIAAVVAGSGGVAYTVSKHGVLGLTRELAFEYGPFGVRVNAVGPGAIMTPMLEQNTVTGSPEDLRARASAAGRYGLPGEIGSVVAFLADDGAGFIHGALIMVDGGRAMVATR